MSKKVYLLLCFLICDTTICYQLKSIICISKSTYEYDTNSQSRKSYKKRLPISKLFSNGQIPLPSCASIRPNSDSEFDNVALNTSNNNNNNNNSYDNNNNAFSQFYQPINFLLRAGFIGFSTGLGVVLLKTLIFDTQGLLYENLADALPKPAFYWPIALYPIIGASFVSLLAYFYGPKVWNGLDYIAKSIDSDNTKSMTDDVSNNLFLDLNIDANINNNNNNTAADDDNNNVIITDNIINSNKKSFNPKQFIYTNFLASETAFYNNLGNSNNNIINNNNTSTADGAISRIDIIDNNVNSDINSCLNEDTKLSDVQTNIASDFTSLIKYKINQQYNKMNSNNNNNNRSIGVNRDRMSKKYSNENNGMFSGPSGLSSSSLSLLSTIMIDDKKNALVNRAKLFLNKISNNTLFINDQDLAITATDTLNTTASSVTSPPGVFDPLALTLRLAGAATTLGSGCSLGPEGPSVEIGAGFSRYFSEAQWQQLRPFWSSFNNNVGNSRNSGDGNANDMNLDTSSTGSTSSSSISTSSGSSSVMSAREKHHLFLAGTAAGVSAGFGAPIAGVFFALECGNRCLARNTVKLEEDVSDAPRADIAAIVLAATLSNIVVQLLLQNRETLFIQGNSYAMVSPFFELPVYFGLALISGSIAVIFDKLKIYFKLFYKQLNIAKYYRPLLGGIVCGVVAIFFPQTLFNGYATLGDLLSSKYQSTSYSDFVLLMELLVIKLLLSSFSLVSGLIGGVFAPSLFFGAIAGTAYHYIVAHIAVDLQLFIANHSSDINDCIASINHFMHSLSPIDAYHSSGSSNGGVIGNGDLINKELFLSRLITFFTISNAQAYATVGAAATLGSLFKAPLTSSMLMFELTQNHDIVLPVLFSTGLGGFFASIISSSSSSNINSNNNNLDRNKIK